MLEEAQNIIMCAVALHHVVYAFIQHTFYENNYRYVLSKNFSHLAQSVIFFELWYSTRREKKRAVALSQKFFTEKKSGREQEALKLEKLSHVFLPRLLLNEVLNANDI